MLKLKEVDKLPVYKMMIDSDETGTEFVSLVEQPAIEVNWKAFNEVKKYGFERVGEEQKLAGYFMIPDLPIYRNDEMGEYMIVFDKEQISKMAEKFNKETRTQNINYEHQPNSKVDGAFIAENWIVDGEVDKASKFGFELHDGGWFGIVKIDDKNFWDEQIKGGKVYGFSIEGLFGMTKIKNNKMSKTQVKLAEAKMEDGTVMTAEVFEVGQAIFTVDADGNQTPAAEGEHKMENGDVIVVDAEGKIAEIRPFEAASNDTPAKLALTPEDMQMIADAMKPMFDEVYGKIQELADKVAALEGGSTAEASKVEELKKKVEELSKKPGAVSLTKVTEPKKQMTFAEKIEAVKALKK